MTRILTRILLQLFVLLLVVGIVGPIILGILLLLAGWYPYAVMVAIGLYLLFGLPVVLRVINDILLVIISTV